MKIGVVVSEGPYTHQAADSAYHFVRAALAAGHEVPRVFFYHDGVNVSTRLSVPPQDERHIQKNWTALAKEHEHRPRGLHRGGAAPRLLDENEANRQGKDANNIAEGFRISGLGQLIEMGIQTDRLVTFGD